MTARVEDMRREELLDTLVISTSGCCCGCGYRDDRRIKREDHRDEATDCPTHRTWPLLEFDRISVDVATRREDVTSLLFPTESERGGDRMVLMVARWIVAIDYTRDGERTNHWIELTVSETFLNNILRSVSGTLVVEVDISEEYCTLRSFHIEMLMDYFRWNHFL